MHEIDIECVYTTKSSRLRLYLKTKGYFPLGGILCAERNFSFLKLVLHESAHAGSEKFRTARKIPPRGKQS